MRELSKDVGTYQSIKVIIVESVYGKLTVNPTTVETQTVVKVIQVPIRVLGVTYDKGPAETIAILYCIVGMVPERANLIIAREIIQK